MSRFETISSRLCLKAATHRRRWPAARGCPACGCEGRRAHLEEIAQLRVSELDQQIGQELQSLGSAGHLFAMVASVYRVKPHEVFDRHLTETAHDVLASRLAAIGAEPFALGRFKNSEKGTKFGTVDGQYPCATPLRALPAADPSLQPSGVSPGKNVDSNQQPSS
ncbi:MAG TPA: hypothetical protein VFP91_18060 [Vicinamibacterales bacterium]|nr:hypothetical protein [Vicinamibacterales bacterium]